MVESKNAVKIIAYVGDDVGYFQSLQRQFQEHYPNKAFKFLNLFDSKDPNHYFPFVRVVNAIPNIIYVDISSKKPYMIRLAQFFKRQVQFMGCPVVALLENKDKMLDCRDSGLKFIFVKCAELFDVINHPMTFLFPEEAKKPAFATGQFDFPTDLIEEVKVGYITADYIHIESKQFFSEGMKIKFKHPSINKLLTSQDFEVKNVTNRDLYYDMNYRMDIYYDYVTEPDYEEYGKVREEQEKNILNSQDKIAPEDLKYALSDFEAKFPKVEDLKKKIEKERKKIRTGVSDWVEEFKGKFKPKKTKILIIDKNMDLINGNKKDLSDLSFTLRFQSIVDENMVIIERVTPSLIVYNYPLKSNADLSSEEKAIVEGVAAEQKTEVMTQLGAIINKLKSLGKTPVILIFNMPGVTAVELREKLQYPQIMLNSGVINLQLIIDMGQLLEKKESISKKNEVALKKENDQKVINEISDEKCYLAKDKCHGEVLIPVNLKTLSESEITFSTTYELKLSIFRLLKPLDVYVTLIPQDGKHYTKDSGKFIYKGLIHGWDESTKKGLRIQVDKIFLKEKAAKQAKEIEEFEEKKKLVEEAAKEKVEADKDKKAS